MSPACPVCGESNARVYWRENLPQTLTADEFSYTGSKRHHGQIWRCRTCSHRFVHPPPTDLAQLYADVSDPFYAATEAERVRTFEEFLDAKERYCAERGRLLDVGCYTGVFMDVAARRGYRPEGLELSRWAATAARARGFSVTNGAVDDLATMDREFDTISAFDVLEHLVDPGGALSAIRNRLAADGCFVATVPDMGTWHARALGRRHWLVVTMHLQYFTHSTLRRLLERAGFSTISITAAPPYRLKVVDAAAYSNANAVLRGSFTVLKHAPLLQRLELRLTASLFVVARR
jgi:2-polyprenyl-3-methyl-5-hydroxy-6-metoxy-1,4-benzoquinol methylase